MAIVPAAPVTLALTAASFSIAFAQASGLTDRVVEAVTRMFEPARRSISLPGGYKLTVTAQSNPDWIIAKQRSYSPDTVGLPLVKFVAQVWSQNTTIGKPFEVGHNFYSSSSSSELVPMSGDKYLFIHTDPHSFAQPNDLTTHVRVFQGRHQVASLSIPMGAKLESCEGDTFTLSFGKDGWQRYTYLMGAGIVPANP